MVLVRKGYGFWEYVCLGQAFVLVTMRSINILSGGSFGVWYSDRLDLGHYYIGELVKQTRVI